MKNKQCFNDTCKIVETAFNEGDRISKFLSIKKEAVNAIGLTNKGYGTYYNEDERYIKIYNFPAIEVDKESKANVIYSEKCILNAIEQYKKMITSEQPFFKYMLDGHEESDKFGRVVGAVDDVRYDKNTKTVYIDFTIYKNSSIGRLISDILSKGDPIGVSMVLYHMNQIPVKRSEIKYYIDDVETLDEAAPNVSKLFGVNDVVQYVDDDNCFIVRFDLTYIPSMLNAQSTFAKKESMIKPKKIKVNNEKTYLDYFMEIKESLDYSLLRTPLVLQIQTAIQQLIDNKIQPDSITYNVVNQLKKSKNFDIVFRDINAMKNLFQDERAEEYLDKISNDKIDQSTLINLHQVIKEFYPLNTIYSYELLYDLVKILTFVYLNPNAEINVNQSFDISDFKEVKINRLRTFLNVNNDNIKKLRIISNTKDFFNLLFSIIDDWSRRYSRILTSYGAVVEALRLIIYSLVNNITLEKLDEQNMQNAENNKANTIKKTESAKFTLKKFYI